MQTLAAKVYMPNWVRVRASITTYARIRVHRLATQSPITVYPSILSLLGASLATCLPPPFIHSLSTSLSLIIRQLLSVH